MSEEKEQKIPRQRKKNYINNRSFMESLVDYKHICEKAELEGKERPQVTRYIGECILKICHHLSYKPNFINYTYKQEMVDDAILNCFEKVLNFDAERSENPFAFFTTIAWNAFLRRISDEKKEQYTKSMLMRELPVEQLYASADHDDEHGQVNSYIDFLRTNDYIDTEAFINKKKKQKVPQALEEFFEEDPHIEFSEEELNNDTEEQE